MQEQLDREDNTEYEIENMQEVLNSILIYLREANWDCMLDVNRLDLLDAFYSLTDEMCDFPEIRYTPDADAEKLMYDIFRKFIRPQFKNVLYTNFVRFVYQTSTCPNVFSSSTKTYRCPSSFL